jgi:hypothetical protein
LSAGIRLPDALIAATALVHELPLQTAIAMSFGGKLACAFVDGDHAGWLRRCAPVADDDLTAQPADGGY